MSPCTWFIGRAAAALRRSAAHRPPHRSNVRTARSDRAEVAHDAGEVLARDRVLRRDEDAHLEDRAGPLELAGRVEEHAEVVEQLGVELGRQPALEVLARAFDVAA